MKYELSEKINNLLNEAIEEYGYGIEPNDEEIWEVAKCSQTFPHFENIFIQIFFEKLINELPKKYTYDYYINGFDSHLYY